MDIEAVYCRYTKNLKEFYTRLEDKGRAEIRGANGRGFPGSDLAPEQWWEVKPDRPMPPPQGVKEELKPDGEGWVFEIRGYTYWKPNTNKQTDVFIMDTLLRNIIARSRGLTEEQKKALTPEQLKALADDPIRGKITHAFLYDVRRDDNPSPGTFKFISSSLINPLVPDDAAGGSGGESGLGGPPPGMGGRPGPRQADGRAHGAMARRAGRAGRAGRRAGGPRSAPPPGRGRPGLAPGMGGGLFGLPPGAGPGSSVGGPVIPPPGMGPVAPGAPGRPPPRPRRGGSR